MDGFSAASTETLLTLHANLRRGLDVAAEHLAAGTFRTVGPKGAAPPSQSGHLTLALLAGIEAELAGRDEAFRPVVTAA